MSYTIIGPGFLGNYLHKNVNGSRLVSRHDLEKITSYSHNIVVVAAPTGNRIQVNQDPKLDWHNCQSIIETLSNCQYNQLVYISTVDTYQTRASNSSLPGLEKPQAHYGANRWLLEQALKQLPNSHVIRLPSISDPSVPKNILYDLKNQQWLGSISLESEIQWYVLSNLPHDIEKVAGSGIDYINLVSPPIQNRDIVQKFTPDLMIQLSANHCNKMQYNIHTAQDQYHVQLTDIWQSFEKVFVDKSTR